MATLAKRVQTRWYKGAERVAAGTPGATKVKEKSDHWYVVYKEAGRVRRVRAYTDKAASEKMLADFHRARERGEAGLADPFKAHLDRPLVEHVAEYLADVRDGGTSPAYHAAVEARLNRVFTGLKAKTLRDVTADGLKAFLRGMTDARTKADADPRPVSVTTRNDHRAAVYTLFGWLVKNRRHPENLVARVPRAVRPKGDPVGPRRRRALSPVKLRLLVRAAVNYPLASRRVNRGGRKKADGTRPEPKPAKFAGDTLDRLREKGQERRLLVLLALFTGLRRGELSRVQVKEFKAAKGVLDVPGRKTKNGRRAVIPLLPALAAEVQEWVECRSGEDVLIPVPNRQSLRRVHLAHLKLAGLPYQTEAGFADWHALRKAANTFLRKRRVSLRLRQRFLRHAAGDLATGRYDDERVGDLSAVVKELTRLWRIIHRKTDETGEA